MDKLYDHAQDEYVPDAPTHRGRAALFNLVDVIEDLANGDSVTADWEDATVWALEVEEDFTLQGGVL